MIRETFAGVESALGSQGRSGGDEAFRRSPRGVAGLSGGVFAVNRKWSGENRALVVRYLRAWNEALRWAQDEKNRDEAIKTLAAAEKIDEQAAANRLPIAPERAIEPARAAERARSTRAFKLTPPMGRFGELL
jgi:ABC-type nitrate/sulfonate/bicarbonate transport system substrate-binding protein